jgi:alpha-tubulin suppressor-like RCC1 family protein
MPDGTVWAWGGNGSGQLGDGTNANADVPVQAKNLRDVTAISAGRDHAMAVRVGGTVWVWGSNEHGELGPAGPSGIEDSNVPLRVLFTTETNPDGD